MAKKYIERNAVTGLQSEVEALVESTGPADAGKIPGLDTDGRFNLSTMPVGIGPDTATLVASEDLSAGDIVSIWDDGGIAKVRKADASNGYRADGFVKSNVTSSQNALVYFEGPNTGKSGLTAGARYYLSATPGGITDTPVTASGSIHQYVGSAYGVSSFNFEPGDEIVLA